MRRMDDADESGAAADGATVTDAGGTRESVSVEAAKEEKARLAKAKRKRRLLKEMHLRSERGVCYLSRVPPQLDPSKLRQIMSQYGELLRIYLVPEDPTARVRRKSAGGHRGEQFSEGWVEFAKKSVAKKVAHLLNGEQIGVPLQICGKKRSKFYYDLWNIKYLSGFKWDHLTEEQGKTMVWHVSSNFTMLVPECVAYMKLFRAARKHADREQKLVLEISAARKERDFYLEKIDQSRALSAMQERAKKKQRLLEDRKSSSDGHDQETRVVRQFSQIPPVSNKATKTSGAKLSKDFLTGIFGKSSS